MQIRLNSRSACCYSVQNFFLSRLTSKSANVKYIELQLYLLCMWGGGRVGEAFLLYIAVVVLRISVTYNSNGGGFGIIYTIMYFRQLQCICDIKWMCTVCVCVCKKLHKARREKKCIQNWFGESERNTSLRRWRQDCEKRNFEMNFKEIRWYSLGYSYRVYNRHLRQDHLMMLTKVRVSQKTIFSQGLFSMELKYFWQFCVPQKVIDLFL